MSSGGITRRQNMYKFAPTLGIGSMKADDNQLDQEYFKKITKSGGRRYSSFPAVAISEGKIIQNYGTGRTDVTHQFYSGSDSAYCISSPPRPIVPKSIKQPRFNVKKGNYTGDFNRRRHNEFAEAKTRNIGLELDARDWVSAKRNDWLSTGELDERRMKSAGWVNDPRKVLLPHQRLSSTDDVNSENPTLQIQYSVQNSGSSRSGGKDDVLCMTTGGSNQRIVSKGELKKKRLTDASNAGLPSGGAGQGMSLAISGQVPEVKHQPEVSSYHIRQKYAKDLERNWFLDELEKAKQKKADAEFERKYDMRLDMFYSPEPGDETSSSSISVLSRENLGGVRSRGADNSCCDDNSRGGDIQAVVGYHTDDDNADRGGDNISGSDNFIRSGLFLNRNKKLDCGNDDIIDDDMTELNQSFHTGLQTPRQSNSRVRFSTDIPVFKSKLGKPKCAPGELLKHFDSTDVLVGDDGQLEESSMSEVETVLHNGQIHEKRRKHKMYRKRRRQRKKYKPFLPAEDESDPEEQLVKNMSKLEQFSVKQLRAMRLKIRKRQSVPLTGLKKFRQVANAVFIAVQFRRILMRLRRNRQRERKKSLKQSKKVRWNADLEIYTQFERQSSPEKNRMPEKFMEEVGRRLMSDLSKLPEKFNTQVPKPDWNTDMGLPMHCGFRFYTEVKKTDKLDIDNIPERCSTRLAERRGSISEPVRPEYIAFMLPEKRSAKREQKRNRKSRSPSRSKSKPKQVVWSTEGAEKPVNKQLPPLVAPSTTTAFCEQHESMKPVSGFHNHSYAHSIPQIVQSKPKRRRRRSKYPSKRSRSPLASGDQRSLTTSDADVTPREIQIWPRDTRQRSYSESDVKFREEVSLWELLKNADIPAKEVKIEIIERKRKKRRKKMAEAAAGRERLAFQREVQRVMAERERKRLEDLERKEEAARRRAKRRQEIHKHKPPFVSAGVAWNQKQRPKPKTWTNKELDIEITRLSGLFFDMRTCSYIRWNDKDQAILLRLAELENGKMT